MTAAIIRTVAAGSRATAAAESGWGGARLRRPGPGHPTAGRSARNSAARTFVHRTGA